MPPFVSFPFPLAVLCLPFALPHGVVITADLGMAGRWPPFGRARRVVLVGLGRVDHDLGRAGRRFRRRLRRGLRRRLGRRACGRFRRRLGRRARGRDRRRLGRRTRGRHGCRSGGGSGRRSGRRPRRRRRGGRRWLRRALGRDRCASRRRRGLDRRRRAARDRRERRCRRREQRAASACGVGLEGGVEPSPPGDPVDPPDGEVVPPGVPDEPGAAVAVGTGVGTTATGGGDGDVDRPDSPSPPAPSTIVASTRFRMPRLRTSRARWADVTSRSETPLSDRSGAR